MDNRIMLRTFVISINVILALLIFQSGFLLKRQEIVEKSSCLVAKGDGDSCWMRPQYKRVILILIDALRYDFLQPVDEKYVETPENKYYRGQMKTVSSLVSADLASIGILLADPPTTTLQRLKALTTGTLPTFIDAGENFSPEAVVHEDNILWQANQRNRSVTLLGDDTWLSLYPKLFTKTSAYDSFDINDLNSVDDKIAPILENEVKNSNSSIIISHFLGVDHCGHKYGPSHPIMGETLRKMDRIISNTVDAMRSDDLLMVIGDHGMTSTGDHGGESENEVRAGILVYSKLQKLRLPDKAIYQIDIVPTLSLLLGLPIPFSNLGTVILELFDRDAQKSAIAMNYEQIKRYAEIYANRNGFKHLHSYTVREANSMQDQTDTMVSIQNAFRVAWTQFDDSYITCGILSLLEVVLFLISNKKISLESIIYRSGCVLLQLALLSDNSEANDSAKTFLQMALIASCCSSVCLLVYKCIQYRWKPTVSASSKIGILAVLFHSISLFSNSFVVYEAVVTRYLLQIILTVGIIEKLRSRPKFGTWKRFGSGILSIYEVQMFLLSMILLRTEPYFHKCREEEIECVQNYASRAAASLTSDAQFYRLALSTLSMIGFNWMMFRRNKGRVENSATLRILQAISWPLISLIVFQSLLQNLINDISRANLVAQIVIVTSCVCSCAAVARQATPIAIYFLLAPVYLIVGDGLQPAVIALVVVMYLADGILEKETKCSFLVLAISYGFYFTGHTPVISAIPWSAAFVGIPGGMALRVLPAIFVLLHLNISAILGVALMAVENLEFSSYFTLALMVFRVMFSCLSASVLRRHLMVWKIFAPKFIFESIGLIAFIVSLNILVFMQLLKRN